MASRELKALLAQLHSQPPPQTPTIAELRAGMELACGMFPVAPDVAWEAASLAGARAEWVRTSAGEDRMILYVHGGGFVMGSAATHRELVSRLARAARAAALVVEYRLAPEHPFPAALEDCYGVYRSLLAAGSDSRSVAMIGDSAGAALVLATLVSLRDSGEPMPAAAILLSPWVDLANRGESITERALLDPLLRRPLLETFAESYLPRGDRSAPLVSPLYANLSGLPPLLIQVGTAEVLYDDSVRLAGIAHHAGVDATLEAWPEMIHFWQFFSAILPEGREAIARIGRFVRERTQGSS